MTDPISSAPAALQHYMHMWNETDATLVRGHLDQAVSEDCWWVDPQNNHIGRDALEQNVRSFREKYPGASLRIASNLDGHNNRYRYDWIITIENEVLIRGFDVATLNDDGLIERVDGFFGVLTRLE